MKMQIAKLMMGLMVLGLGSVSSASLMVEPILGFESGKFDGSTDTFSGSSMGLRLGFSTLGLWVAGDYTMAQLKHNTSEYSPKDLALTVGYDFPILVRGYASYILGTSYESGSSTVSGGGTKLGLGFTMLPLVSINVEMINRNYTKIDSMTIDSKYQSMALSLSLPLDL